MKRTSLLSIAAAAVSAAHALEQIGLAEDYSEAVETAVAPSVAGSD